MISTVRLGSLGEAVRTLQSALNLCLDSDQFALVVDGFFGLSTNRRVREYQSANDLAPDGVVGPLTWESLLPLVEHVLGNIASQTGEPDRAAQRRHCRHVDAWPVSARHDEYGM